MWKVVKGKLVHVKDESRVEFRTRISSKILKEFKRIAEENDSYTNYVIENGIFNLLKQKAPLKKTKYKDRVRYMGVYDKELLEELQTYAEEQGVFRNTVIEHSIHFVNVNELKRKGHKNRQEE